MSEYNYQHLLESVLDIGEEREDRTGVGTVETFGESLHFHVGHSFPLLTTKKMHFRGIAEELLWFIQGGTLDIDTWEWRMGKKELQEKGIHIWDEWDAPNPKFEGDLGPIYGAQLRHYGPDEIDQLSNLIHGLKTDPYSRRHVITMWNPTDIPEMALPPCHGLVIQFYVSNDGKLDLIMHQRSADLFLGLPYNIASYALLLRMVAQVTGYEARWLDINIGCAHIYKNHISQVNELLERSPKEFPQLKIDPSIKNIDDFTFESFELVGYYPHPAIKAPVAV